MYLGIGIGFVMGLVVIILLIKDKEVKKEYYQYYKGNKYQLINNDAIHSETKEKYVIYKSLIDNQMFIVPFRIFYEKVQIQLNPSLYIFKFVKIDDYEDERNDLTGEIKKLIKEMK